MTEKTIKCLECSGRVEHIKDDYLYTHAKPYNVILENFEWYRCLDCASETLTVDSLKRLKEVSSLMESPPPF